MFRTLTAAAVGAAIGVTALAGGTAMAQDAQFIPSMVYRTGPYAPNGIPFADGYADYLAMLNARDGGIGGVALEVEECDTAYNNDRGVECFHGDHMEGLEFSTHYKASGG